MLAGESETFFIEPSDKAVRVAFFSENKLIAGQSYFEQLSLDDEQGNKTVNQSFSDAANRCCLSP